MVQTQDTIKAVFLDALDKTPLCARAAFLDEACAQDAVLRQRVDALLQAHGRPDRLLDRTAVEYFGGEPHRDRAESAGLDGDDFLGLLAPSQKSGSLGRLGRYEVLEIAGRGSMGIVLRAFDETLERIVAIKVLAPRLAAIRTARQRFAREARATAGVIDDNVITIYSVAEAAPIPFFVMPFMTGQSLQQKLDRTGALSLAETLHVGWRIAKGLAAVHRRGLVHRDVKPANILLESGVEHVKLTDFGLARASHEVSANRCADARPAHSGLNLVSGTPMYMSPEQAQGGPVDCRSDLFSIGSLLYTMCTGQPPFCGPTAQAVLKKVCEESPRPVREINPRVPPWLDELIVRLHAKAPADRIASAQKVANLLAARLAELEPAERWLRKETRGRRATRTEAGPTRAFPGPFSGAGVAARLRALLSGVGVSGRRGVLRPWRMAAAVLVLVPMLGGLGLGIGEATGVTDFRSAVAHLAQFSHVALPADSTLASAKPTADAAE
jgi:hypothetical protein